MALKTLFKDRYITLDQESSTLLVGLKITSHTTLSCLLMVMELMGLLAPNKLAMMSSFHSVKRA